MATKGPPRKSIDKKTSIVDAVDASGNVFKSFYIWSDAAPSVKTDPDLIYAKCLVLPGSTRVSAVLLYAELNPGHVEVEGVVKSRLNVRIIASSLQDRIKVRQVDPPGFEDETFECSQAQAYNCNATIDPMTYGDIGALPHSNPPCVLDFLKQRFLKGQMYTTADPLLVAINPFKDLRNATDEVIRQYRDVSDLNTLPPHVFTVARTALENLHFVNKSQTIIVSGESGAGKTEATKQIMRYFAASKSGTADTRIQKAVLAANPVLEAFGNAKTVRNNNSSRFGRFMQLQVASGGGIEHGSVRSFLLEKSRVVKQESEERSYHIFYQFLKGASAEQRRRYKLLDLKDYRFINSACLDADGIDDVKDWNDVIESFSAMRRTPEEIDSILSIVSGVLLMGNVKLEGTEKAQITADTRGIFEDACSLLFLDPRAVEDGMLVRVSKAGGEVVQGHWGVREGDVFRMSLAKAMYDKLFEWIIAALNRGIEPTGFTKFMGMLDIFGFEVFKQNSLEQLFINITNEMLQKNFIDIVFERETRLYREEGISAASLEWTTNEPVITMLTNKRRSLMTVLEDQCLAPNSQDEKFLSNAYATLKDTGTFQPGKIHPNVNFAVVHTIGPIQYSCLGFLEKNKDVLRAELVEVLQSSPNPVVKQLFHGVVVERGKLAKGLLIGSQFISQLQELMQLINSTEPHFIRCVKPNEEKKALVFHNSKVLIQLRALSILEALELRNLGYSYRRPFDEFLTQFRFIDLGVAEATGGDSRSRCEQLIQKAQLPQSMWQIGKSMVFLKQQGMKDMIKKMREAMAAWEPLATALTAMGLRKILSNELEASLPGLVRFQAHARK